jgi:hypothetical protein
LGFPFEKDVSAEVAAISMAMTKAIGELASLSSDQGPYLSRILKAGLRDLEKIDYRNIPNRRRAAFLRKVKARYTELLTTIPADTGSRPNSHAAPMIDTRVPCAPLDSSTRASS